MPALAECPPQVVSTAELGRLVVWRFRLFVGGRRAAPRLNHDACSLADGRDDVAGAALGEQSSSSARRPFGHDDGQVDVRLPHWCPLSQNTSRVANFSPSNLPTLFLNSGENRGSDW